MWMQLEFVLFATSRICVCWHPSTFIALGLSTLHCIIFFIASWSMVTLMIFFFAAVFWPTCVTDTCSLCIWAFFIKFLNSFYQSVNCRVCVWERERVSVHSRRKETKHFCGLSAVGHVRFPSFTQYLFVWKENITCVCKKICVLMLLCNYCLLFWEFWESLFVERMFLGGTEKNGSGVSYPLSECLALCLLASCEKKER